MTEFIAGSGGGKGGSSGGSATEDEDSLKSIQYGSVLDLISEGPIGGLVNGLQSVYLDDTPVEDSSGNKNFKKFNWNFRYGTQDQSPVQFKDGIATETIVNAQVTKNTPVVRSISNPEIDSVRVTLQLPALQKIEKDGDIKGYVVRVKIDRQLNGGSYEEIFDKYFRGKSSSAWQRDFMVPMPSSPASFPVNIRVRRITDDPDSVKEQNLTYWFSYTEIIQEKLSYPNSALAYLRFSARNFNSIPQRKYFINGLKIQLPVNASVDGNGRVSYSGIWNGTFGAAVWCSDPAWCLWDLLTNTRYGVGIPASSLDRYDFYSISQHCNEIVSDGLGGFEPRFSCNLLLNSREEIYSAIQEFVSIFRGIAYYSAGSMTVIADKASDPQYLLGPSNVVDGLFTYSGSSQKTRHTTATVAYQDYKLLGEVQFEYVEDQDSVAKYGIINKDIKAVGCYSRGQAHRLGKWTLLTEQYLTETVSFSVGIESGILLRPGMVISIADPVKSGTRRSGRVSAATTTAITVDNTTGLPTTTTYSPQIHVLMPTGIVETRSVSSIAGNVFTVSAAFSEAPNLNTVFIIETTDIQPNTFRVVSVAEGESGIFSVTALTYNESLYAAIENDIELEFRDISNLSAMPDPPAHLQAIEHLYQEGQNILTAVTLSWTPPIQKEGGSIVRTGSFVVEYRFNDGNWETVETTNSSIRITGLNTEGVLYVQLYSVSTIGKRSVANTGSYPIFGKTALPGNVQNLTIEPISANSARLRWDATVDLDVKTGGKVRIRHSSVTTGTANWNDSIDLIPAVAGANTEAIVPLVEGEILVKFEDDGGRQSAEETSVIVDFPDALGPFPVISAREETEPSPFQGVRDGTYYDIDLDGLLIDGDADFDAILDVDLLDPFDVIGKTKSSGYYYFANGLDLGDSYAVDLQRFFLVQGYMPSAGIDNRLELMDIWESFDGAAVSSVNAKLYLRRTDGDPSASPTWSPWQDFVNGTFNGRAFEFKAELQSFDNTQNIIVSAVGYDASFQLRSEQSNGSVVSSASTTTISFANRFFTGTTLLGGVNSIKPSVGIIAQDVNSGDYFRVTNVTGSSFDITFYNSSNTPVSRTFSWSAIGYGKGP